jgi:hypothetical protein
MLADIRARRLSSLGQEAVTLVQTCLVWGGMFLG